MSKKASRSKQSSASSSSSSPAAASDLAVAGVSSIVPQAKNAQSRSNSSNAAAANPNTITQTQGMFTTTSSVSSLPPSGPRFVHPLHRCRFQTYLPSAILSLAYSPSGSRLALGRANGNIEIWSIGANPPGQGIGTIGWVLVKTIPGSGDPTVQVLRWARGSSRGTAGTSERLFSAGLNGRLIEWDLNTLAPKYASDTYGGAVWCGALYQQAEVSAEEGNTVIALGCEDGTIRLFDLSDPNQPPLYVKSISRHTSRVLSIAYSPDGLFLVTGGSEGMIKLWDVAAGRNIQRITVENKGLKRTTAAASSGKKGDGETGERYVTLIWCITFLSSGTVMSGDSLGNLQIWDLEFGTLKQSFSKALQGDVLALVANPKRNIVYAAGVEGKIVELKCIASSLEMDGDESLAEPNEGKWVLTANHRQHTHDIYALALSPNTLPPPVSNKQQSSSSAPSAAPQNNHLLLSGGVDTQLLLSPTLCFPDYNSLSRLLPFPSRCVTLADRISPPRFLVQHDQALGLYGLGEIADDLREQLRNKTVQVKENDQLKVEKGYSHLLDISVNSRKTVDASNPSASIWTAGGGLNIVCSSLSPDSSYVACSDPIQVKIYQLETSPRNATRIEVKKVKLRGLNPASTIIFSPDSTKLFLASLGGAIQIVDLASHDIQTLTSHVPVAEYEGDLSSDEDQEDGDEDVDQTMAEQPALNRRAKRQKKGKTKIGLIRTLAVSPDQQYLCIADEYNHTWVYDLDAMRLVATLPTFAHQHLALEFHPRQAGLLAVLCARNTLYMYDIETQSLTDYSRTHLGALTSTSNATGLAMARDQFHRLTFDRSGLTNDNSLILQSVNHLCHINLDKPRGRDGVQLTPVPASQSQPNRRDRKRKLAEDASALHLELPTEPIETTDPLQVNFRLISRFRPMLWGGFACDTENDPDVVKANKQQLKDIKAGEKKRKKASDADTSTAESTENVERPVVVGSSLLVIEAPWLNILQQLPQPMARHRYGS